MKYFIKLHWWRECAFHPWVSQNLTIEGDPGLYLERQRARLGDEWTGIRIDFAVPVDDDAVVSPEPDLGPRRVAEPITLSQGLTLAAGFALLFALIAAIVCLGPPPQ